MSKFLDSRYEDLEPYVPGEQPKAPVRIKLNTNESPFLPAPGVLAAVEREAKRMNLYPDPSCGPLVDAMARMLGVQPGQVYLGNGSDEILAFCFQALCPNGVAFADITYGFYPVYAQLYGVPAQVISLKEDFTIAASDYYGLKKTIVIANPNAPTGLALSLDEIAAIAAANPENLLIVDEAYVDFGAESAVKLLGKHENLMVVGTFSKSRAMAGARLGYAVASEALIEDLSRIKNSFNPYNINRMTMAAGVEAIEDTAYFEACVEQIAEARMWTESALQALGFETTKSQANFVFAKPLRPAKDVMQGLREKGILVRWFEKRRIDNWLRITVGTKAQMEILVKELRAMV